MRCPGGCLGRLEQQPCGPSEVLSERLYVLSLHRLSEELRNWQCLQLCNNKHSCLVIRGFYMRWINGHPSLFCPTWTHEHLQHVHIVCVTSVLFALQLLPV